MSENANENQNTADSTETDATVTVEPTQQDTASAPAESTRRDEKRSSAYAVVAGEEAPSAEDLKGLPGYKDEDDNSGENSEADDNVL